LDKKYSGVVEVCDESKPAIQKRQLKPYPLEKSGYGPCLKQYDNALNSFRGHCRDTLNIFCLPSSRQSVQNGFESFKLKVHSGLPDSLFWLERALSIDKSCLFIL